MTKNLCDIFVIIVSIYIVVEMFRHLFIVRSNKCEEDEIKMHLKKSRVLIILIVLIYAVYGMIRNLL